uniref:Tetratricopeptide repeat-containing protein n=1 Tax=Candidatus Kentrum sp. TUN TaxID=2126343 RepID=A0A450ZBH2_9GAMM|nr:MAG: hypothetical protein BECKTUN1418E_GA0071001_10014 [Candidatus Kentron sp. TUN]VFK51146.1 MAG: hypothetical protein BECKTUN1418F_GA0071002_10014 [Candidatus Kentron sp. TUN]VFK57339.1 MAG: hypothetical protein BECKTUN1418D_GA0071000_106113 [Candidatus Kentron sp. TUN]
MTYLTQSLEIRREIGDRASLCATLFNIGHIHLSQQEIQEAIGHFVAVYRIARKIGEAQILSALEGLGHQLGVPEGENGLALWEKLASEFPPSRE